MPELLAPGLVTVTFAVYDPPCICATLLLKTQVSVALEVPEDGVTVSHD